MKYSNITHCFSAFWYIGGIKNQPPLPYFLYSYKLLIPHTNLKIPRPKSKKIHIPTFTNPYRNIPLRLISAPLSSTISQNPLIYAQITNHSTTKNQPHRTQIRRLIQTSLPSIQSKQINYARCTKTQHFILLTLPYFLFVKSLNYAPKQQKSRFLDLTPISDFPQYPGALKIDPVIRIGLAAARILGQTNQFTENNIM